MDGYMYIYIGITHSGAFLRETFGHAASRSGAIPRWDLSRDRYNRVTARISVGIPSRAVSPSSTLRISTLIVGIRYASVIVP